MMIKSKNLLSGCLFAIALSALVSMPSPCLAQVAETHSATSTPATSGASGSTVTRMEETTVKTQVPPTTQSTPQAGSTATGASGLASRVKEFSRNGPKRQGWNTINLGTKYANAVFGGLGGFGFGLQVTSADLFRFVEFRATAVTSTRLDRRFEGEAYFPEVFHKNTSWANRDWAQQRAEPDLCFDNAWFLTTRKLWN